MRLGVTIVKRFSPSALLLKPYYQKKLLLFSSSADTREFGINRMEDEAGGDVIGEGGISKNELKRRLKAAQKEKEKEEKAAAKAAKAASAPPKPAGSDSSSSAADEEIDPSK